MKTYWIWKSERLSPNWDLQNEPFAALSPCWKLSKALFRHFKCHRKSL